MGQPVKYTHEELVEAVQRLQDLGDFDTEVAASRRAGEILNSALDAVEDGVVEGVVRTLEQETGEKTGEGVRTGFDDDSFKL